MYIIKLCESVLLKVASQLLHATSGPVEAVEGSLHQRRHDAAHVHLVSAAVALAVVLHPQSAGGEPYDRSAGQYHHHHHFHHRDHFSKYTHTWPVSCATTKAEEKPSSWFKVQLLTGWHMPVTGA